MGLARIDFSSDYFIFFGVLLALVLLVAVLLERVSPSRQKRRRVDQRGRHKEGGELID